MADNGKVTDKILATGYRAMVNSYMTIHSAQGGETQMSPSKYSRLINFLQEDLAISTASLAVALRHREQDPGPLAMILWQYGLVTLEQLDQIYDWLETA